MIQNIPSIEINDEDGQSVQGIETTESVNSFGSNTKFTFSAPPNSPSPSQQSTMATAPTTTTQRPVTSLDFSVHEYIDDKQLEKRFNNLVFTFKTDMYTLEKRLHTQVSEMFFSFKVVMRNRRIFLARKLELLGG